MRAFHGLCLLVFLLCACARPPGRPSVVVFLFDSWPAAATEQAQEALAAAARLGRTHPHSWAVSLRPDRGVRAMLEGRFLPGPEPAATLIEALRTAGYRTLLVDVPGGPSPDWSREFDAVAISLEDLETGLDGSAPLFAVVRLRASGEPDDARLAGLLAAVRLADERGAGWAVTACTGDSDADPLTEASLQVPVIVGEPGGRPRAAGSPAQGPDVMATILRWAGVDRSVFQSQGSDLDRPRRWMFATHGDRRALRSDPFKILAGGGLPPALYDLESDPQERHDLAQESDWSAVRAELLQTVEDVADWLATEPGPPPDGETSLDEATLEELRSLGYLR